MTDRVVVLETARLTLRRLTPEDAVFMLGLLNDPSFLLNIGDRGVRTLEGARAYLASGPIASYAAHGFGLYLVETKPSGTPAGICGLLKRPELEDVDLGFAFLPRFWSRGYAVEAARGVQVYARDVLGLDRLIAIAAPENAASRRVLEALGFASAGTVTLRADAAPLALFRAPGSRCSGS
jgi:ribosomal-protein-alanine N-acetyltransferase